MIEIQARTGLRFGPRWYREVSQKTHRLEECVAKSRTGVQVLGRILNLAQSTLCMCLRRRVVGKMAQTHVKLRGGRTHSSVAQQMQLVTGRDCNNAWSWRARHRVPDQSTHHTQRVGLKVALTVQATLAPAASLVSISKMETESMRAPGAMPWAHAMTMHDPHDSQEGAQER